MLRWALIAWALLALTGCSTEEGQRAQALLQQAETAQAGVTSTTFEGSIAFAQGGDRTSMQFEGATSGADAWFAMRAKDVPGVGRVSAQVLSRGGRAWVDTGEGWTAAPAGAAAGGSRSLGADAFQELARYVEDVRVSEHQLIEGEQVTTIAGEIDTEAMVHGLARLSGMTGDALDLSQLDVRFGDIRAVLILNERTHLLDAASITFSVSDEGRRIDFDLRYRLTGANEPVELPSR